jgi:glycosyltransferase involved in cell wall biosynthesis
MQLGQVDFVCVSNTPWSPDVPTNREQVAQRIAPRVRRALYVEWPLSPWGYVARRTHGRAFRVAPLRVTGNLWVVQPKELLPRPLARRFTRAAALNDAFYQRTIRSAMQRLGIRAPVLWLYPPTSGCLLRRLGERLAVYHCVDDYGSMQQYERWERPAGARSCAEEPYLARNADAVVVTSPNLYERIRPWSKKVHLMPNVGDVELFSRAMLRETPVAGDLAVLSRPVLGFIGAVDDHKLDLELIERLADHFPSCSIVLIGSIRRIEQKRALPQRANVHYLGPRRQADLPCYVKGMDVCLIPYQLNDYTRSISPLKLYEYLAAGKPVVSTALPGIMSQAGVVHLAQTREEFIRLVGEVFHTDTPDNSSARTSLAAAHSWNARISEIEQLLTRLLESRRPTAVRAQ